MNVSFFSGSNWNFIFEDCYIDSKGSKMTLTEETSNQIEMYGVSSKDKCKTFHRLKCKSSVYVAEEYTRTSKTINFKR